MKDRKQPRVMFENLRQDCSCDSDETIPGVIAVMTEEICGGGSFDGSQFVDDHRC